MSRIAAFFDIDGTIYREGLITEVFKKIIKYELVDKEKWENEVRPAYISWGYVQYYPQSTNALTGPRAYSEATGSINGMGGSYTIFVTVDINRN